MKQINEELDPDNDLNARLDAVYEDVLDLMEEHALDSTEGLVVLATLLADILETNGITSVDIKSMSRILKVGVIPHEKNLTLQ